MIDQYKLVPVEPTQAMLDAETWAAMLAAAPESPQLTIPPGYKLVPIQKLTANTSGVRICTHERAHGIGEHE